MHIISGCEGGIVMAEDLKILQKIFDMMEYGYQALAQYPKSEKFALVTDIKHSMDILLDHIKDPQAPRYETIGVSIKLCESVQAI